MTIKAVENYLHMMDSFTFTFQQPNGLKPMTVLLIDSYDSFTFNLKSLIEEATGEKVVTIHNDTLSADQLSNYLGLFSAVIVGPGPGHPTFPKDVGIIPKLFDGSLNDKDLPILGICLGFQSLCLSQGCEVKNLSSIRHGQVYEVLHTGDALFDGVDQLFKSVRYHSLHVPDLSDSLLEIASCDDNGSKVIMAAKHRTKPWYGVQYHPESICSDNGSHLIDNFMTIAKNYNIENRKIMNDPTLLGELISSINVVPLIEKSNLNTRDAKFQFEKYQTEKTVIEICETFHQTKKEFILLNSASNPGTWSIIGLPNQTSLRVSHSTEVSDKCMIQQNGETFEQQITSIWDFLSSFMKNHLLEVDDNDFPFIGGFMGLLSYEEGHHLRFDRLPKVTNDPIPDAKLIFIENLILVNNSSRETYIVSIGEDNFIQDIKPVLAKPITYKQPSDHIKVKSITRPTESKYKSKFSKCQEYLSSGDSYELCLTSCTKLQIHNETEPWEIYKTLTKKNPSPYSAYMVFDDCVLISSSPERFISWDNESCELRPIKGTVKKTPEMTEQKATAILNTPKEIGENLMIVDLIRHDLYQLLEKVDVIKLMSVEEYSTVFQLVSIIKGHFTNTEYSGIDILSRSLPPGSMTGAPKKRSVEILQELEETRRGIYSGVCGYWSVNNKADWSVIIRSIFNYKTDIENEENYSTWRIGAGGAITVLSDPEGEWQELLTKLDSALQVFKF